MPRLLVIVMPDDPEMFDRVVAQIPGEATWSSADFHNAEYGSTRFLEHHYGKPTVIAALEAWKDTHRNG